MRWNGRSRRVLQPGFVGIDRQRCRRSTVLGSGGARHRCHGCARPSLPGALSSNSSPNCERDRCRFPTSHWKTATGSSCPRCLQLSPSRARCTTQTPLSIQQGKRVKDYLRLAGGPDRTADRNREFILRADGSVVSHQSGSFAQRALFADRGFDDIALLPGDTIVVPPIVEKGLVPA